MIFDIKAIVYFSNCLFLYPFYSQISIYNLLSRSSSSSFFLLLTNWIFTNATTNKILDTRTSILIFTIYDKIDTLTNYLAQPRFNTQYSNVTSYLRKLD